MSDFHKHMRMLKEIVPELSHEERAGLLLLWQSLIAEMFRRLGFDVPEDEEDKVKYYGAVRLVEETLKSQYESRAAALSRTADVHRLADFDEPAAGKHPDDAGILTTREAMMEFDVSRSTLQNWTRLHKLTVEKKGNKNYFVRGELRAIVNRRKR